MKNSRARYRYLTQKEPMDCDFEKKDLATDRVVKKVYSVTNRKVLRALKMCACGDMDLFIPSGYDDMCVKFQKHLEKHDVEFNVLEKEGKKMMKQGKKWIPVGEYVRLREYSFSSVGADFKVHWGVVRR